MNRGSSSRRAFLRISGGIVAGLAAFTSLRLAGKDSSTGHEPAFAGKAYALERASQETREEVIPTRPFSPFLSQPLPTRNGIREYVLEALDREHEVFPGVRVPAWTLGGTIPGTTITAVEGEKVRIKLVNRSNRSHTIHFHGVHEIQYDGVHEVVKPGDSYTYELEASPPGVYLYHSHRLPIAMHVNKGFFGAYIIYPKEPLPPAKELVFIMTFIDTDGKAGEAEFYAFNGKPEQFMNNPIEIKRGELVRLYLINMNIEFAAFHVHGNFFKAYSSPIEWNRSPTGLNDNIGLGWGERAVLEFSYKYPGLWMFHDHIAEHSEEGARGWFKVV